MEDGRKNLHLEVDGAHLIIAMLMQLSVKFLVIELRNSSNKNQFLTKPNDDFFKDRFVFNRLIISCFGANQSLLSYNKQFSNDFPLYTENSPAGHYIFFYFLTARSKKSTFPVKSKNVPE